MPVSAISDTTQFEPVIGLEVHAELETESKMFCPCPVVDSTTAEPNSAVCPVCAGMPGVLPVINQKAVEYALRVALALECEIHLTSIFARKNYFYPDLPKGYQISQYEQPLATGGRLPIVTSAGERVVHIRRVHLEEDTGKLTHVTRQDEDGQPYSYSLVDLNRAGVPLLEIVTEPDLHTPEEVRAYAMALRSLLRYLQVNSGDMQKGVIRIEPNVSVRPQGSDEFGTRTEIKNLNSFRALERSVAYEIERQSERLRRGEPVQQETLGWDEAREHTVSQRSKEEAHDYRYFPEPDLPPLVIEPAWIEAIRASLPELPHARLQRFQNEYGLSAYDAEVLVAEAAVADYYEAALQAAHSAGAKMIANWITGELFGQMNQSGLEIDSLALRPPALAELVDMVSESEINANTAKSVLAEMLTSGQRAAEIVAARGLKQISDADQIAIYVSDVLAQNHAQVVEYLRGKEPIARWLFGQVMRRMQGRADPQVVQRELDRQLHVLKADEESASSD